MRPKREHATNYGQTYMVTTETWGRRALFRADPWARLLLDTLYHYRGSAYLLHAFVVMPDHLHVLLTPLTSLEKSVQFIKGGFSYRAKKELGSSMEVWQKGFSDHRIRDAEDYAQHIRYIHQNPVRKHLSEVPEQYPYSSAHPGFILDEVPQGLRPQNFVGSNGAAKAAPLQNSVEQNGAPEGAPLQTNIGNGVPEDAPFQNEKGSDVSESCAPSKRKNQRRRIDEWQNERPTTRIERLTTKPTTDGRGPTTDSYAQTH
jgi:putative transposase